MSRGGSDVIAELISATIVPSEDDDSSYPPPGASRATARGTIKRGEFATEPAEKVPDRMHVSVQTPPSCEYEESNIAACELKSE